MDPLLGTCLVAPNGRGEKRKALLVLRKGRSFQSFSFFPSVRDLPANFNFHEFAISSRSAGPITSGSGGPFRPKRERNLEPFKGVYQTFAAVCIRPMHATVSGGLRQLELVGSGGSSLLVSYLSESNPVRDP